ncbi:hypothetical protein PO909_021149 [Leuciscus waleckii]
MEKKTDISENDPIVGYFHGVSPIKTSRKNTRYFNATVQTARQEYHQAVFFTPEKYNSIVTAQKNKTPVKLNNARKTIDDSLPDLPLYQSGEKRKGKYVT